MRWKIISPIAVFTIGMCWLMADQPSYPVERQAAYPTWWYDYGLVDQSPTAQPGNYSLVTIGQLKNMAQSAARYLDVQLASVGGAGGNTGNIGAIHEMVDNFAMYNLSNSTANYQAVQMGQLKNVAKPFYDRLIMIGYNTTAQLIAHGYPSTWTSPYPWTVDQNNGSNTTALAMRYQYANLGQLKMVFGFDLSNFTPAPNQDFNSDGVADAWEVALYGNLTATLSPNWTGNWGNFSASNGAVPDAWNANPASPAILTVSIVNPLNGSSPP